MSKQTFSVDDTLYRAQAKKLVKQLKLDETKFVRDSKIKRKADLRRQRYNRAQRRKA
jgi:hypothetical protein